MSDALTPTNITGASIIDPTTMALASAAPITTTAADETRAKIADQRSQLNGLIKDIENSPSFDTRSGAPAGWQAAVYDNTRPDQQLETLHNLQQSKGVTPDAIPYGSDNFIY